MRPFIIADNQFITGKGMLTLLGELGFARNIREVSSITGLLEELKLYPDAVVILDYTLFDFSDIRQMINLREGHEHSSWLLFSDELGEPFLRQVLLLDSSMSIVMKGDSEDDILNALNSVYRAIPYVCNLAAQVLTRKVGILPVAETLTATEKIILQEIARGKTTKEIAFDKNLSFHTINSHRRNVFRKLHVNNVQEAIKYAIRAGIIDLTEYYI